MLENIKSKLHAQDRFIFEEVFSANLYGVETDELKGKVILDVGANIGAFSFYAIEKGALKVIAIEPHPVNFSILQNNIDMMHQEYPEGKIITYNGALTKDRRNIGMISEGGTATVQGEGDIPSKTLLDVCEDANILKMDCEGSEFEILLNLSKEDIRKFELIYIEIHGNHGKLEEMKSYIRDLGYDQLRAVPYWMRIYNEKNETIGYKQLDTEVVKYRRVAEVKLGKVKLNIGCGDILKPGYINCDLYNESAEVKCDAKTLPFPDNYADEIFASHLIEHFDYYEAWKVLAEWWRVLKPEGKLIVETPDFLESCRLFPTISEDDKIKMYAHFWGYPHIPGLGHKFLYTENQLRWTLSKYNFKNIIRTPQTRYVDPHWLSFPHLRLECVK